MYSLKFQESPILKIVNRTGSFRCSIIVPADIDEKKTDEFLINLTRKNIPNDYEIILIKTNDTSFDEQALKQKLPNLKFVKCLNAQSASFLFDKAAAFASSPYLLFMFQIEDIDIQLIEDTIKNMKCGASKLSIPLESSFVLVASSFYAVNGGFKGLHNQLSSQASHCQPKVDVVKEVKINHEGKNVLLLTSAATTQAPFSTGEKRPPAGIGFLISVLRDAGHNVYFIDNYLKPNDFLETDYLWKNKIDYVGIYSNTICYRDTMRMFKKLQELRLDGKWLGKIMVGGPHTTVAVDTIPDYVDYVVQGEGEKAIVDIVEGKVSDRIVCYPRIRNLDELPSPAWDYFVDKTYDWSMSFLDDAPIFTMNTSRGCPFKCNFCSVCSIWGKNYIYFSAERVVSDIEYLIKQYGAKGIYFREDNFTLNRARLENFCNLIIEKNIKIQWVCESRVSNLDAEIMHLMAKAGLKGFYFGVESGSQRLLDMMEKGITVDEIRNAFKLCKQVGVKAAASIIVGIPGETIDDIKATELLLNEIKPDTVWKNVFVGIPDSKLYQYCINNEIYEYIDDRGLIYLPGHNERVRQFYGEGLNAAIPFEESKKDMADPPKISVLMSVHNGQQYIEQALESIYNQSYQDFEVIIVDDASTDKTPEILLKKKDCRTSIYRNSENLGLTKSLNIGLKLCRGQYIARMDADDISYPQRFEKQMEFFKNNTDTDVLGCWCHCIDEEGAIYACYDGRATESENLKQCLLKGNSIAHGTAIIRRKKLVEVEGYNEKFKYAQDHDLWLRLSEVAKLNNLPMYLYGLRSWPDNISNQKMNQQHQFSRQAIEEAMVRRNIKKMPENKIPEQGKNTSGMVGVLFSKDRAMQLKATLDSFYLNCTDSHNIDMVVLYRTTNELHRVQYEHLKTKYDNVQFIEEGLFRDQLISIVKPYEYVLFLVDDNIFIRPFKLEEISYLIAKEKEVLGFSLRLGRNTNYCYSLNQSQCLPSFEEMDIDILKYKWPGQECDFGYALEVSSSVYRCCDMLPLLQQCQFKNPNELEGTMDKVKASYEFRPYLLTFEKSVTFCNPVNVVQKRCYNRHGIVNNYTSQQLAEMFSEGMRVDVEQYLGWPTNAAHQEAELFFKKSEKIVSGQIENDITEQANDTVKFSIVMANYNNEKYVAEAIESVLKQTFDQWELLIIDDCSTDNSLEVIQPYLNDKRIRLIQHSENKGYIGALKTGINNVRSKIFGILDSDDALDGKAVEIMYNSHTENSQCGLIYSQFLCCDESLKPRGIGFCGEIPAGRTNLECNMVSHFKTFKLDYYLKTAGYDERICHAEDVDIINKMEEVGGLKYVNENLYYYRELANSVSHISDTAAISRQNAQRAKIDAYKRRGKDPLLAVRFKGDDTELIIDEMNDCNELGLTYIKEQNYADGAFLFNAILNVIEKYFCSDFTFSDKNEIQRHEYLCMRFYTSTVRLIQCYSVLGVHNLINEVYERLLKQEHIKLTKHQKDELKFFMSGAHRKIKSKSRNVISILSKDTANAAKKIEPVIDPPSPKFSVIMANYNNGQYISEAIESVLDQTFRDWELIIIDDVSTDNSLDVIQPYLIDKRIRLIKHQMNGGYIAALKTGIDNVRSEIFGILDSDDYLRDDTIEIMYKAHIENPSDGLIYSQHVRCDDQLNPLYYGVGADIGQGKTDLDKHVATAFRTFKLKDYHKSQGYEDTILYAEDRDICFKMEEVCGLKFIDQVLYYNRELAHSQSHESYKVSVGRINTQRARMNAYKRRNQKPLVGVYDNEGRVEIILEEVWDCYRLGLRYIDEQNYEDAKYALTAVMNSVEQYCCSNPDFTERLTENENKWLRECFYVSGLKLIRFHLLSGKINKINDVYDRLIKQDIFEFSQGQKDEIEFLMSKARQTMRYTGLIGDGTKSPKFSIIMPNYNNGKYIGQAIESLIKQTFADWELIIVDDGSTDNSIEVIKRYLDDKRIRLIKHPAQRECIAARKTAISNVKSEYFGELDSDDVLRDDAIEIMYRAHIENPDYGMIYSQHFVVDENLNPVCFGVGAEIPEGKTDLDKHVATAFRTYKLKDYHKSGGYDDETLYAEDQDIPLRMEEVCGLKFIDQTLYFNRVVAYSQCHDPVKSTIGRQNTQRARLNAYKRRGQKPVIGLYENCGEMEINLQEIWDCSQISLKYIDEKNYEDAQIAFVGLLNSVRKYFISESDFTTKLNDNQKEWLRECLYVSTIRLMQCYTLTGDCEKIGEVYNNILSDKQLDLSQEKRNKLEFLMTKFEGMKDKNVRKILDTTKSENENIPLVSMIMPVYNGQKFLKQAIESVLAQDYQNIEIIIINDGSTDNSKDIILSFTDNRIRYFEQENKGLAATHNTGIKKSNGQFVIKVDSDDYVTSDFVSKHIEVFNKHPRVDLVYCDDVLLEDGHGKHRIQDRPEYKDRNLLIRDLFRCGFPIIPFRTCIKRSVFDKIGFFDESLRIGEDYEMMRRFVKAGLKAHHLPEALYFRRLSPESLSRNYSLEKARSQFGIIRKYAETFANDELFPDVSWYKIPEQDRNLMAKSLAAMNYIQMGQFYLDSNLPDYAKVALENADIQIDDCLNIEPENSELQRLKIKSERLQQLLSTDVLVSA